MGLSEAQKERADGTKLSPQSFFHVWKAIRAFYKWALEERLLLDSPAERIKMPKFRQPEVAPLTPEEVKKIIKVLEKTKPCEVGG